MSEQAPVSKPLYGLLPTDVEGFDFLAELALATSLPPTRQQAPVLTVSLLPSTRPAMASRLRPVTQILLVAKTRSV